MALSELVGFHIGLRAALAVGFILAGVAMFVVMPRAIRKLTGAGISGRDRNKPSGTEPTPEMGGLVIFLAFNVGVFAILALANLAPGQQAIILASLVVLAGAAITGVLDDLVSLRQRFKAVIPFIFAAPLALYLPSSTVEFPLLGTVDFLLLYPLILVPAGIACASNGFNILEGFNGLGAGIGIVIATALAALAIMGGNFTGLVILFPLLGALGGFLYFNAFPAKVFPGDTGTLFVGAALGAAAMLSKIEFWGLLLFVPHVIEFGLKATAKFDAQSFASSVGPDGILRYDGKIHSIPHIVMKRWRVTEPQLVAVLVGAEVAWAAMVILAAWLLR